MKKNNINKRFLVIGDIHLSDIKPQSRIDSYTDTCFNKLEQCFQLAVENNCCAILQTGDIYHLKNPAKTSHSLIIRTMSLLKKYEQIPFYAIVGNHDILNNSLASLPSQPLGVMAESGLIHLIDGETIIEGIRIIGFPFKESYVTKDFCIKRKGDEKIIEIIHALATDGKERSIFGETIFGYADLAKESDTDVYVFGHWHKDQGVINKHDKWFVNIGSLTRGALDEDNIDRQVKCAIIDIGDDTSVTEIPLKMAPSYEVFNLETREEKEKETEHIKQFVQTLNERFDVIEELDDPTLALDELGKGKKLSNVVYQRAKKYLEEAET